VSAERHATQGTERTSLAKLDKLQQQQIDTICLQSATCQYISSTIVHMGSETTHEPSCIECGSAKNQ